MHINRSRAFSGSRFAAHQPDKICVGTCMQGGPKAVNSQ
jgi:hypothetical protein